VVALHLCGDVADHPTESADKRSLGALRNGHGKTELATHGCHLGANETGADDQDSPWLGRQCSLQPARIIRGSQRE
jgi:hypothetical protein